MPTDRAICIKISKLFAVNLVNLEENIAVHRHPKPGLRVVISKFCSIFFGYLRTFKEVKELK